MLRDMPIRLAGQELQLVTAVTLSGVVVDAVSGVGIQNAVVSIPSRALAVLTGVDGSFELRNVPTGTQVLLVQQFGYGELVRALVVRESPNRLDFRLQPSPIEIESLTVTVDGAITLFGRVVDGVTGKPMQGVFVWLPTHQQGASTDEAGAFVFQTVPTGPLLIQVEHVGYCRRYIPTVATPPWAPMVINLEPDRAVIQGIPLVNYRLRGRRNAHQGIVRAFDAEGLAQSAEEDARLIVQNRTFAHVIPCRGQQAGMWCVEVAGQPLEPDVCIDGELVLGGMDNLQKMRPHQLYLLEVYYAKGGASIRACTHEYMEALARGSGSILAVEPTPQRAGVEGLGWSSGRSGASSSLFGRCWLASPPQLCSPLCVGPARCPGVPSPSAEALRTPRHCALLPVHGMFAEYLPFPL